MNNRLQQFIAAENISQSQFADSIHVTRANVSHILAGRNKPGYDFMLSLAERYPNLSLDWLIRGKGRMYKTPSDALFPSDDAIENEGISLPDDEHSPNIASTDRNTTSQDASHSTVNQRKISRITIFFDDGTYQEIK